MSGKSIGKHLNYGFAGNFARQPDMVIGSFPVDENSRSIKFGEPVFLNDDEKVAAFENGGTEETFVGVASSEVKSSFDYNSMEGEYAPNQMASVMQRGAISVLCNVGEPKTGGKVYIRVKENATAIGAVLGGFEAKADGDNTVLLKNCVWRSDKDGNQIAELFIRTINFV